MRESITEELNLKVDMYFKTFFFCLVLVKQAEPDIYTCHSHFFTIDVVKCANLCSGQDFQAHCVDEQMRRHCCYVQKYNQKALNEPQPAWPVTPMNVLI